MAFDNQTRKRLARLVSDCRRLLTDEFSIQLQQHYGIQPDGQIIALEQLSHLDDEQRGVAALLRERISHIASGLADKKGPAEAAIKRLLREQAFTVLNRFAALRMCEERELVQECVRQGMQSRGFQVFLQIAGSDLGDTYHRYRTFLRALFDEISVDLGLLFDRFSPSGLLFPREAALEELFSLLNTPELQAIWAEDETIGWIYQYFNSKEERQAMRKASAAPRNSRELAVRNQFFTPRYVVEFLTDNTLGRTWYEMRQGQTRLIEQCRYLVRRPYEVFLQPGKEAPEPPANQDELSQEELLRQPHHITFRTKKDPRDLKILDPACGSGHFLLYAFDLLQTIYEEAWGDHAMPAGAATGSQLHRDYPDRGALLLAIPELILRHNLHGIDIDPRAVQIAALALWLRSQRAWKEQKVNPEDRPRIRKSHIVCAEPMPGEKQMLKEFTATLQPPLLGQIVEKIFDRMQLAGEAGSLLKIEEEIQESISQAKEQWQRMYERASDKLGNQMLFTQNEMDDLRGDPQLMLGLFDVSQISDADFWETVEERILAALRDYAERSGGGQTFSRRMFAEDAAKGFAFIDLCRKRYDVVLMNPPFGETTNSFSGYLLTNYAISKQNLYIAFIERSTQICKRSGTIGSITDRTFITHTRHENFRNQLIYGYSNDWKISYLIDHGWGVLDSYVQTASSVLSRTNLNWYVDCFDLKSTENAAPILREDVKQFFLINPSKHTYIQNLQALHHLPKGALSFWMPAEIVDAFKNYRSIDPMLIEARSGLSSSDNNRFYKLVWEVPRHQIGKEKRWIYLANGGEPCPFYRTQNYVIDFEKDGAMVKQLARDLYTSETRTIKNQQYYRRCGLSYGKRTENFTTQMLPSDQLFSNEGHALFSNDSEDLFTVCAYLNATITSYILNCIAGLHKESGYVGSLPVPSGIIENRIILSNAAKHGHRIVESAFSRVPESQCFISPFLGTSCGAENIENNLGVLQQNLDSILVEIDTIVINAYDLSKISADVIGQRKWSLAKIIYGSLSSTETNQIIQIDIINWLIGMIFSRWDIRIALNNSLATKLKDPLESLATCSPSMLISPDGLPAHANCIVSEEWLRARPDANSLPPEGSVKNPTIRDEEYPLRISWQGILVDDAFAAEGNTHQEDILRRTREVIELLWKDRAPDIEQEACEILGVKSLRDYFRKPGGFFQDHLKRYSKSRRQAPIYWPLSSENGNYTLWIYYHRLTDQFLYTCVNDYVNPRIEEVTRDIEQLQKRQSMESARIADSLKQLESLQDFLIELKGFRDELLRVARLPYKPDLNDGVIITAAPLWQLFRLPKWRKDLKACWEKLQAGDYDWAHLAFAVWPDRVRRKCVTDKSLAIAHDLVDLYNESSAPKRKHRTTAEDEIQDDDLDEEETI